MSREIECTRCKGEGKLYPNARYLPDIFTWCDDCDGSGEIPDPDRDPTPWCHVCGSMTAKGCDCPKPFYAENH